MVQPGLEPVAADEITRDLGGEVKKTSRGFVVFRVPELSPKLLKLRTTEDVYLLAWGSDSLTYKSADLATIRDWTATKPKWHHLLEFHAAVRGKPKGKPSIHLVCQKQGEHGYRRVDALDAMTEGLGGKIPRTFQRVSENAYLEVWLTIHSKTAICGVRLSDRTMRHRTYKGDHIAASLRPTVAAAMARLAGTGPNMIVLDPMCGAGTLLAEQLELAEQRRTFDVTVLGGDIDAQAVYCAKSNLDNVGRAGLARWDTRHLPLAGACIDRVISNPPFGKQMAKPEDIGILYAAAAIEWDRVLKPGGRAVLLVSDLDALREAVKPFGWKSTRQLRVRVLGQPATISVWQKPGGPDNMG